MTYKILNGQVDAEGSAFFSKQVFETVTRGNDAKLYKTRVYSARYGNYFSNRVINLVQRYRAFSLPGQFAPRSESANRTLANSFRGTFTPWPFRSLANSFPGPFAPGPFAPGNESSMELSFPGTFVPWNFRSLELSLP